MAIEFTGESETPMPEAGGGETGETVDVPVSMLAGQTVAPGDVIRLEVVSVNDDSGTVSVKYAVPKTGSAIDEAASQFEA